MTGLIIPADIDGEILRVLERVFRASNRAVEVEVGFASFDGTAKYVEKEAIPHSITQIFVL